MLGVVAAALLVLAQAPTDPLRPAERGPPLHTVDMVVAQVDGDVITLSELMGEARLALLKSRGPEVARTAALTAELLSAVLRQMVMRALILGDAKRLQLREVPEEKVLERLEAIKARFETPGDYTRFLERAGLASAKGSDTAGRTLASAPPALVAILRSELMAERFVALRTGTAPVRDADVERCWEVNREILGNRPLSAVRPLIEQAIRDAQVESALVDLVTQLEKKATLRYHGGFAPGPIAGGLGGGGDAEPGYRLACPLPADARARR